MMARLWTISYISHDSGSFPEILKPHINYLNSSKT
ncbi:hypothetical protein SAMN05216420_105173 [Nitrosospira sp. Nl5]|nr:hypothetical protein SAMN05216420_105173 [Nitrosospira sp. Nl5]